MAIRFVDEEVQNTATVNPIKKARIRFVDDEVNVQPQQMTTVKKGRVEKAASFLGLDKLGKRIGSSAVMLKLPGTNTPIFKEGRDLQELRKTGEISPENYKDITTGGVSGREVAGGAANLALLLGTLGLSAPATLGGKVAQGAKIGAGFGAAGAVSESKDLKDAALRVGSGTLMGGAIPGIVGGVKNLASSRAARLYDSILGVTKNEGKEIVKSGATTVGQKIVLKGGLPGFTKTKQGIYDISQREINRLEPKVQEVVKGITKKFSYEDLAGSLQAERDRLSRIPGEEGVVSRMNTILETAKGNFSKGPLTAGQLNDLKRELYQQIGKAFEKPEAERAMVAQAQTSLARSIRNALAKADPTGKLNSLNEEQGLHLEIRSKILDQIAKGTVKDAASAARVIGGFFRPGNLIRDAGTAGLGAMVGGVPGAIAGTIGERALTSTPSVTARAKLDTLIAQKQISPALSRLLQNLGIIGMTNR